MAIKQSIFEEHLEAWLAAKGNKKQRGALLRHICFVAKVHPKSIPRSFRRVQLRDGIAEEHRGRKTYYTPDTTAALKDIWDSAGEPCGENLHSQIGEYVRILRRDRLWKYGEEVTGKLLAMSLGTLKDRVGRFMRTRATTHGKTTTKPGNILSVIPVRTGPWHAAPTGTEQIDTVAHCGHTVAGDFVYTVNATDIATLWGSRCAQWNKGQEATVSSMQAMNDDILFPVIEWHPDTGSEFVNWHCHDWCVQRKQRLTRSRPNHKNDNCFVEERNGHVIRRWVGYSRFDAREVVGALNDLYQVLTPYLNHFSASRRIVSKERVGAKWKVVREKEARTPYARVLTRADVSEEVKTRLREVHERLNPLLLKREIDQMLKRVFDIQKRYGTPKSEQAIR